MSTYTLTKTRLTQGVWEGIVSGDSGAAQPEIAVTLNDTPVEGVTLLDGAGDAQWLLHVPVPLDAIADGVQTILIRDARADETLGSFSVLAGEVLGDNLLAEMDLLRAELDMLKRAFRRHCLETAGGA